MIDFNKIGDYSKLALRSFGHRAELVSIELAEARNEAVVSLLLLAGAAALLLLFLFCGTLLIAAAVWETAYRIPVLGGLSLVYLAIGGTCAWTARQRLKAWKPFEATADQFRKDGDCIEKIFSK